MTAHSLIRIKSTLVNTPHLIEENSFKAILDYVNSRNDGSAELNTPEARSGEVEYHYVPESKTGVLHISGPLTYRTTGWEAWCGGTSYEMLKEQMEYYVGAGAKTVTMMVDSGGGQAHSMMDTANYIRKLADDNGIKLIAYVDGSSCSAAYGLSCIADEIISSADSMVGSVGVLIQLMNNSKQLEKAGIERTFITAGKDKVPFAADGSFTEDFVDRLQEQVDALYEGFTSHVAGHRGMDVQAVKDTEAGVFMTSEALKLGLIDKVMTVEEFYDYLTTEAQTKLEDNDVDLKGAMKLFNKGDATEMAKLDELTAQLETQGAELATALAAGETLAKELSGAQEQIAQLTSQLDGFKAEREAAEKAAAEQKLESRKASLAEVMPADQVESKLAAYAALDDNTFAFMVGELGAAKQARAESMAPEGGEGAELQDTEQDSTAALLAAGIAAAKALRS